VKVAAVDIGTNSMRLLIVDDGVELGRWERVTGLGRGRDADGTLTSVAMDRTLLALAEFGGRMSQSGVEKMRAVATSASRDAPNRAEFFDKAELALGVRPELISGEEEAGFSFAGATTGTSLPPPHMVVDIGGGSTEFVTAEGGVSLELGSVRLTDRFLPDRPCLPSQLAASREEVAVQLATVPRPDGPLSVLGVAGTWTSLSAMAHLLASYDRTKVHGSDLSEATLAALLHGLAGLSIEDTVAAHPSLDPARAPVILAGAVVAEGVFLRLGCHQVTISEHDLLDGVAAELAAG